MNTIAQLEFELASNNVAVHNVCHDATMSLQYMFSVVNIMKYIRKHNQNLFLYRFCARNVPNLIELSEYNLNFFLLLFILCVRTVSNWCFALELKWEQISSIFLQSLLSSVFNSVSCYTLSIHPSMFRSFDLFATFSRIIASTTTTDTIVTFMIRHFPWLSHIKPSAFF